MNTYVNMVLATTLMFACGVAFATNKPQPQPELGVELVSNPE